MSNFTNEFEELRKIREAKYQNKWNKEKNNNQSSKPEYNYELRKDFISRIIKIVKSEVAKERMDKIEKKEYQTNISKICLGDLDYFAPLELKPDFMTDLFKYNNDIAVLERAYSKQSTDYIKPQFGFIKEYMTKSKADENFLIKLIQDYLLITTNMIQILTTTNLQDTKFETVKQYVLEIFFNPTNTQSISFEQTRYINSKIELDINKFIFLISRCSNKSGYSKCDKTCVERPNINLIKNMIHDMETKYKCKIDIDLYI
jgi:hypothetical protein